MPKVAEEPVRRELAEHSACAVCGKPMPTAHRGTLTCSRDCGDENRRRKARQRAARQWERRRAAREAEAERIRTPRRRIAAALARTLRRRAQ